jgi:hypothetical protein
VDGFVCVRIYRALRDDISRYFIHYELISPDVLTSQAYLDRLNAPTPWSRRIMPMLGNFGRGGGRVLAKTGNGHGCVLAAIKFDPRGERFDTGKLENIVASDRIVAARLLETDVDGTTVATLEKSMRRGDGIFPGLLLIEGVDEPAVAAVAHRHALSTSDLFREIFQLD